MNTTQLTDAQLEWTLKDIAETLKIWRDEPTSNPYVAKLLREWDAALNEKSKRNSKGKR